MLSEDKVLKLLIDLENDLEKINSINENRHINIFDAVGMSTQEVKHSAFLAWLLDPKNQHGLNNEVLSRFLLAVKNYPNRHKDMLVRDNSLIIGEENFETFLADDNLEVKTEKVVTSPESRIDIFIHSQKENITVVIENKVFTGTHDNQLKRYEEEVKIYPGKKIFIYLTPKGDIPTDANGEYNDNWCIMDYGTILNLLRDFEKSTKKTSAKLRYLIGDYIEMVENNILKNNPKIREKCKEIIRKHAKALEIINMYSDNVDSVFDFAVNWLNENVSGIFQQYKAGRRYGFCTKLIEEYFASAGIDMQISKDLYVFSIGLTAKDGPVKLIISLYKGDEEWSAGQIKIRDIVSPGKSLGDKYCTLYAEVLLSEEERQLEFADVEQQILQRLQIATLKIKEIENALL